MDLLIQDWIYWIKKEAKSIIQQRAVYNYALNERVNSFSDEV